MTTAIKKICNVRLVSPHHPGYIQNVNGCIRRKRASRKQPSADTGELEGPPPSAIGTLSRVLERKTRRLIAAELAVVEERILAYTEDSPFGYSRRYRELDVVVGTHRDLPTQMIELKITQRCGALGEARKQQMKALDVALAAFPEMTGAIVIIAIPPLATDLGPSAITVTNFSDVVDVLKSRDVGGDLQTSIVVPLDAILRAAAERGELIDDQLVKAALAEARSITEARMIRKLMDDARTCREEAANATASRSVAPSSRFETMHDALTRAMFKNPARKTG